MCNQTSIPTPRRTDAPRSWRLERPTDADSEGDSIDMALVIRTNLVRLMQERGLALESLARRAGLDPQALREIAFHDGFPSVGQLWKLAHALDVPCTAFVEPTEGDVRVVERVRGRPSTEPQPQIS
jgi:hypothetical protein